MKEYCVVLGIAKELKENGFPQESNFYHRIQKDGIGEFTDFSDENTHSSFMKLKALYSAPCSDEILKELPDSICLKKKLCGLIIEKVARGDLYSIAILHSKDNISDEQWNRFRKEANRYSGTCISKTKSFIAFKDKGLSNALAKMWLYLKREGYIK